MRLGVHDARTDRSGDEPSDGPKRGIGRFLMESLLAPARSSGSLSGKDIALRALMEPPKRTRTTSLSDDELLIFDAIFD